MFAVDADVTDAEAVSQMEGLTTHYTRESFMESQRECKASVLVMTMCELLLLPVAVLLKQGGCRRTSAFHAQSSPLETAWRCLAWCLAWLALVPYFVYGCKSGHYEKCNVTLSEAATPLLFFVLECVMEAHGSALYPVTVDDNEDDSDNEVPDDPYAQRGRRRCPCSRSLPRPASIAWAGSGNGTGAQPPRPPTSPLPTSFVELSPLRPMQLEPARAPSTSLSAAGPAAAASSNPYTALSLSDAVNVGSTAELEYFTFDAPEQLIDVYPEVPAQAVVNPVAATAQQTLATPSSVSRAPKLVKPTFEIRGRDISTRNLLRTASTTSANQTLSSQTAVQSSQSRSSVSSVAGRNYTSAKRVAPGSNVLRVKLSSGDVVTAIWRLMFPVEDPQDIFIFGLFPVSRYRFVRYIVTAFLAFIKGVFPLLFRFASVARICKDEVQAARFNGCFPNATVSCGVYDLDALIDALPFIVSVNSSACQTVCGFDFARMSLLGVAFGATGPVGVLISAAGALGTFFAAFLLFDKLNDVAEAYLARYRIESMLTDMYRGKCIAITKGCLTSRATQRAHKRQPLRFVQLDMLNSDHIALANTVAFILSNAADTRIQMTGYHPLAYVAIPILIGIGIFVSELFTQGNKILLDNSRVELLIDTGIFLGYVLVSMSFACLANLAQAHHRELLAEHRMVASNAMSVASKRLSLARNSAAGAAIPAAAIAALQSKLDSCTSAHCVLNETVHYLSLNTRMSKFCGVTVDVATLTTVVSALFASAAAQVVTLFLNKTEIPPSLSRPQLPIVPLSYYCPT